MRHHRRSKTYPPVRVGAARGTARSWAELPADRSVALKGWTLVLNPDGTTTAWNKDKTKTLHSHGPPVRPG